ncbi:MAG: aminodeoxychorismate/anthranilate synthase component II [Crocinitomicaceae bacterium]|nr:aminodeoxychorismate/anthranilate synthase component II [Crocinitomicaceae bacterium]
MKITVIDNYDSFVYNLVRYLEENDGTVVNVMRNDTIDNNILSNSDAIVLSPGPGIPEEAGELMSIIEKYHTSKPLLGICLGHQAIGEFFGELLVQNNKPLHGKSTLIEQNGISSLFKNIKSSFEVGRYHSWSLKLKCDSTLKAIASTPEGEIMAIKHTDYPIYGLQFHPESILTPTGRTMIKNWMKLIQTNKLKIN